MQDTFYIAGNEDVEKKTLHEYFYDCEFNTLLKYDLDPLEYDFVSYTPGFKSRGNNNGNIVSRAVDGYSFTVKKKE